MVEPRLSLCLTALVAACSGQEERSAAGSSEPAAETPARASRRAGLVTYRPLLDEAARAELRARGVMIDFGTPDQHKYTRGGWRSGWGAIAEVPEAPAGPEAGGDAAPTTWGAMAGRRGWLELAAEAEAARAITLRARSAVPGQTISFHAGGRQLGAVSLRGSWTVVRAELPPGGLPAGRHRLELRAARAGAARSPAAEVDWLWITTDPSPSPAPVVASRVGPLTIAGAVRRTIAAPTARTYSFYLTPPAGAQLVTDLGAAGSATFAISATADGRAPVELLREGIAGSWRERVVSLASFAGTPIRLDLTTVDQQGEAGWGEPEIALARTDATADARARPAPSGARPKNIIVIVIDTARADAFGPFGGEDRVARTPRYDKLAAASTAFTSAYNNENWTKPSVATLLSGLYPSTHDTKRDASELPGQVELLSQRLQKEGFATAGFVANGYISEKFGFERGWDRFKNYIRENRPSEAEHVYREALAWLKEHRTGAPGRPYFLYIQSIDPHVRYDVAEKYWRPYFKGTYGGPLGPSISAEDQVALSKKRIAPDRTNVAWLRALYYGEVTYHDENMGRFLDQLDSLGERDKTLIVVTNDHGEELGERGRFGHGHQVHEEMVRAPLLISYPPLFPPGARIEEIVEHVDVAPTLLDALGRDPLPRADGQSFLPLVRGEPTARPRYAIIEFLDDRRAIRVDRLKLTATAGGGAQLHDLGADPGERKEASAGRPIARRLCEVHLGEGLAVPDKAARMRGAGARARFRAGTADIDPAVRRQLEALGYFGSEDGQEDGDDQTRND
jgi:arylsulfatase A-like enzyme